MLLFEKFKKAREARARAISEAREKFLSWHEISNSNGWKLYVEQIDKKVANIINRMTNDTNLSNEDLKRLQLALQVYREVQKIPKELEENARGGK